MTKEIIVESGAYVPDDRDFEKDPTTLSDFISGELDIWDYDSGQLEDMERSLEACRNMIGTICSALYKNKTLDEETIREALPCTGTTWEIKND